MADCGSTGVKYTQEDHDAFRGDGRMLSPCRSPRSVAQQETNSGNQSVTQCVTDAPSELDEVGNLDVPRSVTDEQTIGNQKKIVGTI